jgi:antitoxin component YwqK of YwqJK toxin-antitoxin module
MTPRQGPPPDADSTRSGPVPETVHYPNGRVKYTGFLLDGEMHGEWQWFRTDGSLMRSGAFDRGRQIGIWRTFDRSGAVVKETRFNPNAVESDAVS